MIRKLILACALAGAATVWADSEVQSEVVDGVTWYYRTTQEWNAQKQQNETYAYIVAGADKYTGDLSVPAMLGTYPVKKIGNSAFYQCVALKSVVIPEGVTDICGSAFQGCGSLLSVTLPSSLNVIENYAFHTCRTLPSITIPKNVKSIGKYAFYECSVLKRFDIPASVASIGEGVLRSCYSLIALTVAEGNGSYWSTNNCVVSEDGTALVAVPLGCEEVDVPFGVAAIPDNMFEGSPNIQFVTLPNSLMSIGTRAFFGCDALTSVVIPEGVVNIGPSAFHDCVVLTSVVIPRSVITIGSSAFYHCAKLTSVTMSDGVTTIGDNAFDKCYELKKLTVPASVTSIGHQAFQNCSSLADVRLLGQPPTDVGTSCLLSNAKTVSFSREYGGEWMKLLKDTNKFLGYNRVQPEVSVISSKIRANDPTILDVVYKVTSSVTNTVKVRALAFEEGERSFAKVVRPTTFVADPNGVETAGNVGDAVAANVEHTLSWKVSADWSNQLAKVTFEVLATEGDLLPLEVRTIPASDQYGKMDVTWNAITVSQWFDALLWLYADQNPKVTLSNGVYYYDGKVAAKDTAIYYNTTASSYYSRTYDPEARQYVYVRYKNAPEVVLEEMGYTLLSGEVLNYVNEETRLGLSPSGARQYGYRIVDV